jgi:phospholipid/cholesterol/gamma-HCH transport system substrate-binding protein
MSPSRRRSRRHRRGLHPLAVALLVIMAAAFITFFAFNRGLPFVHHYTLHAVVSNSVNVRSDSPVRIAGIDVGSVQNVSPEGQASKITFTMNSVGLPVHRDATVRIRDRLFLEGGYYLQLDPGTPAAPLLHDGDTIPLQQTSSPVQFYKVLSTFDVATRASLKGVLDTFNQAFSNPPGHPLSDSGAGGFKQAVPQLTPTLKDVALITRALRGTQVGDLERLLSSASAVTSTVAASDPSLADLVRSLNRTSSALAASDGALAQSVSGLDQTLQVAPRALAAVDHALPPTVALAVALDPSLKLAPPILVSVTGAVRQLARVVAPAERSGLLTTLRATFQQFPSILHQLAVVFPITKQVTDCLRTHVVPVLRQQAPDGSLSSGHPIWQDFVHFLPGLSGASGSFDANGPYTRVLAAAGTNSLDGPTLPGGLGKIVGGAPPGNSTVTGARPAWIGDLTAPDFRPDARCAAQRVPSLAARTAPSDLHAAGSGSPLPIPLTKLRADLAANQATAGALSKP